MVHQVAALRELRSIVVDLSEELSALETLLEVDVPSSLNKIRFITEKVLHQVCTEKNVSWGSGEPTLERMIGPLNSGKFIPKNVSVHVRTIQNNTSPGSHYQESPLNEAHVECAFAAFREFLLWHHDKKTSSRPHRPKKKVAPAEDVDREILNPYEFAATASDQTFKGRDEELNDLLDSIRSGTHTAIFGLQRMGKTSLIEKGLQEVLAKDQRLTKEILIARIDLQSLGGDQVKYRDLVHAIVEAITASLSALGVGRSIKDLRALTHELFSAQRFQRGDRTQFFEMFAKLLREISTAARRRIVLFIDEFSEVRKVIEKNKKAFEQHPLRSATLLPHDQFIDVPFIHHLGSLLKDRDLRSKFTLIVLVRPFMSEYDEREELQILKLMKPISLFYLDEAAARSLITEPLEGRISYGAGAVEELSRVTAGHPYLLQFILKLLVDRSKRESRRVITLDDVRGVEAKMVSQGPTFDAQFEVLVSDYSIAEVTHSKEGLLGKGTLALIAKLGHDQSGRWVDEEQIFDALVRRNVPVEKAASILSQLTRTSIIEEENQDGQLCYRIVIPLLHERFIKQNLYLKYFR